VILLLQYYCCIMCHMKINYISYIRDEIYIISLSARFLTLLVKFQVRIEMTTNPPPSTNPPPKTMHTNPRRHTLILVITKHYYHNDVIILILTRVEFAQRSRACFSTSDYQNKCRRDKYYTIVCALKYKTLR